MARVPGGSGVNFSWVPQAKSMASSRDFGSQAPGQVVREKQFVFDVVPRGLAAALIGLRGAEDAQQMLQVVLCCVSSSARESSSSGLVGGLVTRMSSIGFTMPLLNR